MGTSSSTSLMIASSDSLTNASLSDSPTTSTSSDNSMGTSSSTSLTIASLSNASLSDSLMNTSTSDNSSSLPLPMLTTTTTTTTTSTPSSDPGEEEGVCWLSTTCSGAGSVGEECMCIPGYSIGYRGCEACAPGFFKGVYGFEACRPCNGTQGRYADEWASTGCGTCAEGTYAVAAGDGCAPCENQNASGISQRVSGICMVKVCVERHVPTWDRTDCVPCPEGWSTWNGEDCVPPLRCEPPLVMSWDAKACVLCPEGWSAVGNGQSCVPPLQCEPPLVMSWDAKACVLCPDGWTPVGNGQSCVPPLQCEPPLVMSWDAKACVQCPDGWSAEHNGQSCVPPLRCEPPWVMSWDARGCVLCPEGWSAVGQRCVPPLQCESPLVMSWDGKDCVACPVNWTWTEDGGCKPWSEPCAPGFVETAEARCVPCPVGTRSDGWRSCVACAGGSFNEKAGSTGCAACPVGKAGAGGGCSACEAEAGWYAPVSGLTACLECDTLVWDAGSACHAPECGANEYWRRGLPGCQPCMECQDTTYAMQRCNSSFDTVCADCRTSCPPHYALTRYCTLAEDSVCTLHAPCPPGSQREASSGRCVPCPWGTYGVNESCLVCAEDGRTFPNGAQTACVEACEAGAYLTAGFYCAPCAPGTGGCALCPENTYTARAGQVACLPCPRGTWALPGSSACSSATCLISGRP